MNFLAHLYLSGESEELLIGNFIADAVKGSNFEGYAPLVVKGIKLHRRIDAFTDSHPIFLQSKRRLAPHFDKYSGVMMDIFYDHFLAVNWHNYHRTSLDIYAQDIYTLMKRNTNHLPERSKFMLPYMIKGNWLYNYAHLEGIQSTLNGLSRRTKFTSSMEKGLTYLQQDYALYEKEFAEFFPLIIEFVKMEMQMML